MFQPRTGDRSPAVNAVNERLLACWLIARLQTRPFGEPSPRRSRRHWRPAVGAEPHVFGNLRTRGALVGSNRWVVPRKTPLLAVLLGRQASRREMPAKNLVGSAVFETDQRLRSDRPADLRGRKSSGRKIFFFGLGDGRRRFADRAETFRDLLNDSSDFAKADVRVGEVSRSDFRHQVAQVVLFFRQYPLLTKGAEPYEPIVASSHTRLDRKAESDC
jgi:hypothetical protein